MEQELRNRNVVPDRLRWTSAAEFRQSAGSEGGAPRVVVAMGVEALRSVIATGTRSHILATLVPRTLYERILRETSTGTLGPLSAIYLDQPISRQLDLIRLALPQAKRISVLLGPDSGIHQPWLASAAATARLELAVAHVSSASMLPTALQSVLEGSDVFLALPDAMVFNNSSISSLLLSSYRAQVPMVAFSPAYVKAGALISLHSTPGQIGTQAAALVRAMLDGEISKPVTQYPSAFSVSVNVYVARSLNMTLDAMALTERLRRLEAKP